ncbi:MAG: hypothetical protein ACUVR8_05075 [Acidobacteriota bacterium]
MACGSPSGREWALGGRRCWVSVVLLGLVALAACAREPFRVRPKTEPPVSEAQAVTVTEADYRLRARAVWDGNELVDRFDANHLTAGMLPVYVWLDATASLDLSGFRFRLRDALGQTWQQLSVRTSEKRLMKSYGIRAYNLDGYQKFRRYYADLCFPTKGTLAGGQRTEGFLFFEIPRPQRDLPAGTMWLEVGRRAPSRPAVTRIELPALDVVTSPVVEE